MNNGKRRRLAKDATKAARRDPFLLEKEVRRIVSRNRWDVPRAERRR